MAYQKRNKQSFFRRCRVAVENLSNSELANDDIDRLLAMVEAAGGVPENLNRRDVRECAVKAIRMERGERVRRVR